jgi:DNA-binding NarL/FixJ family response regulator
MTVVSIVHGVPAYRHGLGARLSAVGFEVLEADCAETMTDRRCDICLVHVPHGTQPTCIATAEHRRGDVPVVALLEDATPARFREALNAGLDGVVAVDAQLQDIVDTVHATLAGRVSLPIGMAQALAHGHPSAPTGLALEPERIEWLRKLAHGVPIARIGEEAGYSERHMYRAMRDVYRVMGVRSREQAIVRAALWGLLDQQTCFEK